MERMDFIFNTLRTRKISATTLHAIINLYLSAKGREGKVSLSSLASKLGITAAAITRVADAIEKHGLATRAADEHDRRQITLSLTPRGFAFAEWFGDAFFHSSAGNPRKFSPLTEITPL